MVAILLLTKLLKNLRKKKYAKEKTFLTARPSARAFNPLKELENPYHFVVVHRTSVCFGNVVDSVAFSNKLLLFSIRYHRTSSIMDISFSFRRIDTVALVCFCLVFLAERRKRLLGSVSGTVFLFTSFVLLVAAKQYQSSLR